MCIYAYMCACVYMYKTQDYTNQETIICLPQSFETEVYKCFSKCGIWKQSRILFPKTEVFFRSEIKIITATEEGKKRECKCGAEQPGPNHLSVGKGIEG